MTSASEIIRPPWGSQPFLLCVAQHRRNKNILLALRAFERLLRAHQLAPQTRLLIVGIPGPDTSLIEQFVTTAGLAQRVIFLNGISDELLHWCYSNCQLLLAPSTIEGFGLPVAEALLAGCRIVCSDISAFRELGGNHCHYVPLGSQAVEAFADAVRIVISQDSQESVDLPQLSAPVIAEQYMQLYQSLLSAPYAVKRLQKTPFLSHLERRNHI